MSTTFDERPKLDRTWLCSVVFLDIVQYSKQSVELQATWKGRLNRYMGEAIQDVHEADRVILDTGDGAAICFLGDPEPAMLCALRLLAFLTHEEPREGGMRARVGIHLGPVKLVRDINGNVNAIGDGINVGERVMSFASENQILVSRSFYEVASCLSERYIDLFTFSGVRKDKHERQHVLYELRPPREPGAPTEPTGFTPPSVLDPGALDRIEGCLAQFVGPIAHHLVRNATGAGTAEEVCQAMLAYIPVKEDQRRFLELCGSEVEVPPDPDGPEAGEGEAFDPAVLERAKRDLAAHIGPVARVLVDRAAARARSEEELYQLLAAGIPSPDDRARFQAGGRRPFAPTPPHGGSGARR